MKLKLLVILMVLTMFTFAHAEEDVPYPNNDRKSVCDTDRALAKLERIVARSNAMREAKVAEKIPCETTKTSCEMLATVNETARKVDELNEQLKILPTEIAVKTDIEPVKQPIETVKTERPTEIDLIIPILIGLYIVCFIFGGIVFSVFVISYGYRKAMNEIKISNSQQLWNQYLKSFMGGQTNGK